MDRELSVHFLPDLFEPDDLRGGIAVVIDVLRASTTIVHALANGARSVIPVGEVEAARQTRSAGLAGELLLGGEREGKRIEGFDLGNSPLAYTKDVVEAKTIVFTTTNGVRAMLCAKRAERVLVGAFVNAGAVVRLLVETHKPVHLVCAGTDGRISAEDVLCAGALADGMLRNADHLCLNDTAVIANDFYNAHCGERDSFFEAFCLGAGSKNLFELGYDDDVHRSAQRDLFDLVPEYFSVSGEIRVGK